MIRVRVIAFLSPQPLTRQELPSQQPEAANLRVSQLESSFPFSFRRAVQIRKPEQQARLPFNAVGLSESRERLLLRGVVAEIGHGLQFVE